MFRNLRVVELRARQVSMGVFCLIIALGLMGTMSCSGFSSNSGHSSNTASGSGTNNGGSGGGSESHSQYLFTANNGASTISGFKIDTDGTLGPVANSPFTTTVPASKLSMAGHSLLVGGCNSDGTCGISLYSVAPQTGALNLSSSTSTSGGFSVALDPSASAVYTTGGTQANPNGTVAGFSVANGLSPLAGSPYQFSIGGGSNPVTSGPIVVDPSGKFLYMGSITPQNEHTPAGNFGLALRNPDGTLSGFSTVGGCISAGSMEVASEPGSSLVYASCVDDWSGTHWIACMIVDASSGNTTSAVGFVGPDPNDLFLGLAADPSGKWLAVTDVNNNLVHIMSINPATGALSDSPDHIFPTGTAPNAAVFDHTGNFLYVTNGGYAFSGATGSNNVSAYAFDAATGMLTPLPGSPYAVGQSPTSVTVTQP